MTASNAVPFRIDGATAHPPHPLPGAYQQPHAYCVLPWMVITCGKLGEPNLDSVITPNLSLINLLNLKFSCQKSLYNIFTPDKCS